MVILYNLSIYGYWIIIHLAKYVHPKAKLFVEGRKKQWNEIKQGTDSTENIWFHCASLGEFDQAIPIMNAYKERNPGSKIIVTFFSPSGMLHYSKRKHCADEFYYLPLDTKKNAVRFIDKINPTLVFFIKYEFWFNYIFELKNRNIPIYSASCILRPNQVFFKKYGGFFRKGLSSFNAFFVQNIETKNLLNTIGIYDVFVTGDTRFDKVIENKKLVEKDIVLEQFLNSEKAIVLGSSWPIEEEIFRDFYSKHSDAKVIIAPHDISEKHLQSIEKLFPNQTIRYSQFDQSEKRKIVIIDCIGKLANAYSYGKVAFIGGGFTGKLHNTLEPVVFGLPVIFGPKHSKFPEAQMFIDKSIGYAIESPLDFEQALRKIEESWGLIRSNCEKIINESSGASIRIIDELPSRSL